VTGVWRELQQPYRNVTSIHVGDSRPVSFPLQPLRDATVVRARAGVSFGVTQRSGLCTSPLRSLACRRLLSFALPALTLPAELREERERALVGPHEARLALLTRERLRLRPRTTSRRLYDANRRPAMSMHYERSRDVQVGIMASARTRLIKEEQNHDVVTATKMGLRLVLTIAALCSIAAAGIQTDSAQKMKADVHRLVVRAKTLKRLWPWEPAIPEVARVARRGKRAAPLLLELLDDDPDPVREGFIDEHVQQQAALALCKIYGVIEQCGRVYCNSRLVCGEQSCKAILASQNFGVMPR
jgi:hypothetical protein